MKKEFLCIDVIETDDSYFNPGDPNNYPASGVYMIDYPNGEHQLVRVSITRSESPTMLGYELLDPVKDIGMIFSEDDLMLRSAAEAEIERLKREHAEAIAELKLSFQTERENIAFQNMQELHALEHPTRNGTCEWVSAKTLISIIDKLTHNSS